MHVNTILFWLRASTHSLAMVMRRTQSKCAAWPIKKNLCRNGVLQVSPPRLYWFLPLSFTYISIFRIWRGWTRWVSRCSLVFPCGFDIAYRRTSVTDSALPICFGDDLYFTEDRRNTHRLRSFHSASNTRQSQNIDLDGHTIHGKQLWWESVRCNATCLSNVCPCVLSLRLRLASSRIRWLEHEPSNVLFM